MNCEAIRPVIRSFLDDLLDEKDYQEIQSHLAGCPRCHSYASSVGTLSYGLYELGQVSVPPDMASVIFFELSKHGHAVPSAEPSIVLVGEEEPEQVPGRLSLFWVVALVVLVTAVVAVITLVSLRRVQNDDREVSTPTPSLQTGSTETTAHGLPEMKAGPASVHWHYHVSRSSLSELKQLFQDLYLTVLDESSSHIVFYVPKDRLGKFTGRMAELTGVVKEFGEIDPSRVNTEAVQVSLYLE